VDEHILAVVLGEEAEALLGVEPLDLAGWHRNSLMITDKGTAHRGALDIQATGPARGFDRG
jgi:hypothetical protein